jgi:hypothetical protein
VSLDDSIDEGVSDLILDDNPVDDGTRNEELVFNVDEVLAVNRKEGDDQPDDARGKKKKGTTDLSWIALR